MSADELIDAVMQGCREAFARVCERHVNLPLCRTLAPESPGTFFAAARHLADDIRAEADQKVRDFLAPRLASALETCASDSRLMPDRGETGTGSIGEADESGGARSAIAQPSTKAVP